MKKEGVPCLIPVFLILIFLFLLPFASAADAGITPSSPLYAVDKSVDNALLSIKSGEAKAKQALKINEERVAEAKKMLEEEKQAETLTALNEANKAIAVAKEETTPNLESDVEKSTAEIVEILQEMGMNMPGTWDDVEEALNQQLTEQEKVKIATELTKKIAEYCDALALTSFEAMLEDDMCSGEDVPEWLEEYIDEEIMEREEEAKKMVIEMLTTCVNDPRQCDCSKIPVADQRQDCEVHKDLAIKCEFENDMASCDQLDSKAVVPSGMPDFLKPIFEQTLRELIEKKSKQMFEKFAPQECKDAGAKTKEECEAIMMEKYGAPPAECIVDGKFIGEDECRRIMEEKYGPPPTECLRDGAFIGEDECEAIMVEKYLPQECKDEGVYERSECERLMIEKYVPEECKAVGAYTQEACEPIMQQKMAQMQEQFEQMQQEMQVVEGQEGIPQNTVMIYNPDTGEYESMPVEQIPGMMPSPPSEGGVAPPDMGGLQDEIGDLQEQLEAPSSGGEAWTGGEGGGYAGGEDGGYAGGETTAPSTGEGGYGGEGSGYSGGDSGGYTGEGGGEGGSYSGGEGGGYSGGGGESSGSGGGEASSGSSGGGDSGSSGGGDSGGSSGGGGDSGGSSGGGDSGGSGGGGGGGESAPTGGFWMIDFIIGKEKKLVVV